MPHLARLREPCAARAAKSHYTALRIKEKALAEIKAGRKESHWMWYVFPQIAGLGMTSTANYYAIRDLDEAKSYLADETLRPRLIEISSALLERFHPKHINISTMTMPEYALDNNDALDVLALS